MSDEKLQELLVAIKKLGKKTLEKVDDDTLEQLLQTAHLQVILDGFPENVTFDGESQPIRDLATKYLALHTASFDTSAGQGLLSEKVDVIERHYADKSRLKWWNSSVWGRMYYHLWEEYGESRHYAVIQH